MRRERRESTSAQPGRTGADWLEILNWSGGRACLHEGRVPVFGKGGGRLQEAAGGISAKLVKELRDKTGGGMMDCKKVNAS